MTARRADDAARRPGSGREQATTASGAPNRREGAVVEEGPPPAPWHFKVLLVGTVLYLIYRLVWFVFWLTGHAWHG